MYFVKAESVISFRFDRRTRIIEISVRKNASTLHEWYRYIKNSFNRLSQVHILIIKPATVKILL